MDVGHTDTDATTVLHVPDLGLSSPAVHRLQRRGSQYLLEGAHGGVQAAGRARPVAGLQAAAPSCRSQNKDLPDDPLILEETRAYLLDALRLLAEKLSPQENILDDMTASCTRTGSMWGRSGTPPWRCCRQQPSALSIR